MDDRQEKRKRKRKKKKKKKIRQHHGKSYQAVPAVTGGSIQPQVASIKEKRRKRKKKKIMNSGRMGSLANNGQQPHVKEFLR